MRKGGKVWWSLTLAVFCISSHFTTTFALTETDIGELQSRIAEREAEIAHINNQLESYRRKINEYGQKSASLLNDIALIENELALAQLDITGTENEIGAQDLEIQIVQERIRQSTEELAKQKKLLGSLLFELQKYDERGVVDMVFGSGNFHDVFNAVADIETVNDDLRDTLASTQLAKTELETQKKEHEAKLAELSILKDELEAKVAKLDVNRGAKEFLVSAAQDSESQYRVLMSELRAEQQAITSQIAALQSEVADKINASDVSGGASVITWPLDGRITALFHDPTYPYRHLFEHSGLDIAVPQGTTVEAAAPGYVAWARTGTMYGNYVMIIHTDGLATLYAHMSRLDVSQDQYVSRGQIIGLSGNTGFSSGPHLHFEVRVDGIPADPLNYLTDY